MDATLKSTLPLADIDILLPGRGDQEQESGQALRMKDNDIGVEQLFSALKTAGHGMGVSGLLPSCWPRQGLHFLAPPVEIIGF